MLIKELNLISFGKFKNKVISLDKGINIIYGKNEAGKTTIHKFIEGMFFGFFRPYTKVKRYEDDYEKYLPWNSDEYKGTLKYVLDGNVYRIERNFLKNYDELKMYDDITGDDLTDILEYDEIIKLSLPAPFLLGINNAVVYNNTANIGQLDSKTDEELAKEVKDSLVNLGGSLNEDVSVKNALSFLDSKLDDIGTKRRKTSPYGQLIENIDKLHNERKNALEKHNEILEIGEKLKTTQNEMEHLEKEKNKLNFKIDKIESMEKIKRYNESKKIKKQIDILEEEREKLKEYAFLNFSDYEKLLPLNNQKEVLEKNISNWKENLINLKNEIEKLQNELKKMDKYDDLNEELMCDIVECLKQVLIFEEKTKEIDIELEQLECSSINNTNENLIGLNDDIYRYEEIERERDRLEFNRTDTNLFVLEEKYKDNSRAIKKNKMMFIIFLIMMFATMGFGFVNTVMFFVSVPLLIGLIYTIVSKRNLEKEEENIKKRINEIKKFNEEIKNKSYELNEELEKLLLKYHCKTKRDLKELYTDSVNIGRQYKRIEELNKKKEKLIINREQMMKHTEKYRKLFNLGRVYTRNDIKKIEKEYKEYVNIKNKLNYILKDEKKYYNNLKEDTLEKSNILNKIKSLLKKNDCNTLEEFKEGLNNKKALEEVNNKIRLNELDLEKTLGKNSLEELKRDIEKNSIDLNSNLLEEDKEKLKRKVEEIEEKISRINIYIAKLEESTFRLSEEFRPLVEIDEEIGSMEAEKKYYEEQLEAINLAKNTIETISKDAHREFAPTLNAKVSDIVKKITDNKYKDIKINENIEISIVEPINGEIKNIECLSGGTIDQLYFAMRFAIIDIITKKNVPLILDDCFIQYDRKRLTNILKLLGRESKNRQIILFTCHEIEGQVFDKLDIEYNLVEL